MTTPVHFMGREYASVDEMPPQIRQLYEQLRAAFAKKYPDRNVDEIFSELAAKEEAMVSALHPRGSQTPPAWASHGAQGTPVPTAFEAITQLGPAVKVYLVKRGSLQGPVVGLILSLVFLAVAAVLGTAGFVSRNGVPAVMGAIFLVIGGGLFLLAAWNLWSLRSGIQSLVLYRDGFAYRLGQEVRTWGWAEIATVLSNETVQSSSRGAVWTDRKYTLCKKNGDKVVLDNFQLEEIRDLVEMIKQSVYALLLPPLKTQYDSGQPVTFGPVTISKQNGIQANGKQFVWTSLLDVKVKQGSLLLTMKDSGLLGGYHKVRASTIPNIELLCQIIGVEPASIELAYY